MSDNDPVPPAGLSGPAGNLRSMSSSSSSSSSAALGAAQITDPTAISQLQDQFRKATERARTAEAKVQSLEVQINALNQRIERMQAASNPHLKLKDHPIFMSAPSSFMFRNATGPYGMATWLRRITNHINDALKASQHLGWNHEAEMVCIRNFLRATLEGTEHTAWAESTQPSAISMASFSTWETLRTGLMERICTPAYRQSMDDAFRKLTLTNNKFNEFVANIDNYLETSVMDLPSKHALKRQKILDNLSYETVTRLHIRYDDIDFTTCSAETLAQICKTVEELAREADKLRTSIARPSERQKNDKERGSSGGHAASASADAQGAAAATSSSPGGANQRQTGDSTRGRPGDSTMNYARKLIRERARLKDADVDTVAERLDRNLCVICGDKKHAKGMVDCTAAAFTTSSPSHSN